MIKLKPGDNIDYQRKQIDYYAKMATDDFSDPMRPALLGSLAKKYGVSGQGFSFDHWEKALMGYNPFEKEWWKHKINNNPMKLDPKTHKPLKAKDQIKKDGKERRAFFEIIPSQDKSIDIFLSSLSDEEQKDFQAFKSKMIEQVIYPILNDLVLLNRGKGLEKAKEIAFFSYFHHIENRAQDPFDHTHIVIANSVVDEDGKHYALQAEEIYKASSMIEAIWMTKTKEYLENKYNLSMLPVYDKEDAENPFLKDKQKTVYAYKINGVPQNLIEHYSKRHDEIEKEASKHKSASAKVKDIAQVETREQKTDLSAKQLRDSWRFELKNKFGIDREIMLNKVKSPKFSFEDKSKFNIDDFLNSLHRKVKDDFFTEEQFKALAIKTLSIYSNDFEANTIEADRLFKEHCLVAFKEKIVDPSMKVNNKDLPEKDLFKEIDEAQTGDQMRIAQVKLSLKIKFTSSLIKKQEQYVIEQAEQRSEETGFALSKKVVADHLRAYEEKMTAKLRQKDPQALFRLNTGQLNAYLGITTEKGALSVLAGVPGAGKSTVMGVVKEVYEQQGYRLLATATAAAATKVIKADTGIDLALNTSKLLQQLDKGKLKLTNKDILIWDEMGMSSSQEKYRLFKYINEAGAKVIAVGDHKQLQSVSAGGLFREFVKKFNTYELTEINRQKTNEQRQLVQQFGNGQSEQAFKAMVDMGMVDIKLTKRDSITRIAKDFIDDSKNAKDKSIYCSLNSDALMINQEVQSQQVKNGFYSKSAKSIELEIADKTQAKFIEGDRIILNKNINSDDEQSYKATNSEAGTIKEISLNQNGNLKYIEVEMDGGKKVKFGPDKCRQMKLGYCTTTYKSQGATKDNTYIFGSPSMNNLHDAYVKFSRHRHNTKYYINDEMIEQLGEKAVATDKMIDFAKSVFEANTFPMSQAEKQEFKKEFDESISNFTYCRRFLNQYSPIVLQDKSPKTKAELLVADFQTVIKQMSKTNYKLTTLDFELMSKDDFDSLYKEKLSKFAEVDPVLSQSKNGIEPQNRKEATTTMKEIAKSIYLKQVANDIIEKGTEIVSKTLSAFDKFDTCRDFLNKHLYKIEPKQSQKQIQKTKGINISL